MKRRKRSWLRRASRAFVLVTLVALAAAWFQREEIAHTVIADAFAKSGIVASYEVENIGPQEQVLTNIVIGDADAPDLTIDRLVLTLSPRFGLPDLASVTLLRPRLYGTYRDGTLSFGALDTLLESQEEGAVEFPNIVLGIEDGRGLIDTDYGRVGLRLDGGGHLRGGFSAELAAVGERIAAAGCTLDAPTLYGELSIDAERPHFIGPLRFASLACADSNLSLASAAVDLDVFAQRNLTDFEGEYVLGLDAARMAGLSSGYTAANGQFVWRDGNLDALYDLQLRSLASDLASAGMLAVDGRVRASEQFARIEVEGDLSGSALSLEEGFDRQLAGAAEASEGTLAAPLLDKVRANLARELAGSTITASFEARRLGERTSLVFPQARLRGGSGANLLALSRAQLVLSGNPGLLFDGNFQTGGDGLPQISGRMEQGSTGAIELRMAMREFSAGDARLSVPRLAVLQGRGGRIAIEGNVQASGPLPGGFADGLVLPIDGTIGSDGSIALWNGCRDVRFDSLTVSSLTLARQSLMLCPQSGQPILRYDARGLQLAAGASALDLAGELAETPVRMQSGPVGIAYPGAMAASDIDITLGPEDNAQRFSISDLRANISADAIGGEFSDADIFLAAVPQDFLGAQGSWAYSDSVLTLNNVAFLMRQRGETQLLEPLAARGASLTLADNVITANAIMRHPASGRAITRASARHDLATTSGHLDLAFDGITFDDAFQPTDLSSLALGVIANVEGTVTGEGRVDWDAEEVTSSGHFSSDALNLAAAFGPVEGASGTVVFTDLLGMTTAPDQRIRLAAINPGVEVNDGEIGFQLINGETIALTSAQWPFMGGTLTMRPVNINIGVEEYRTYILDIEGLQASQFIERMEMGNLAASGVFDGSIPIIFDPFGDGQLVGGSLVSRAPGGNLSYIGELTYEDMGYFANFVVRMLRDLQYERMEIDMNGPLTGELVTQVRFAGIGQGATAETNFVSRAIADLPIELRINIRAPFFKLMTSIRALYDPASIRDPRSLGLLTDDGVRLREAVDQDTVDAQDAEAAEQAERELIESLNNPEPDIQPPESEPVP